MADLDVRTRQPDASMSCPHFAAVLQLTAQQTGLLQAFQFTPGPAAVAVEHTGLKDAKALRPNVVFGSLCKALHSGTMHRSELCAVRRRRGPVLEVFAEIPRGRPSRSWT
jgi:hypothetical protein